MPGIHSGLGAADTNGGGGPPEPADTARVATGLGGLLGPLRRAVLRATRNADGLPDLPEAQIELLRTLSTSPEGLSPGAVAARLRMAPSTVSNLVRSMSAEQLVERVRPAHDQRTVVLTASREALELLERYDRASTAALTRVVDELPAADRLALARALPALDRLVTTLETTDDAATGAPRP
ncbi:MarR family winged helix-turn-helix transcriptional regulator [Streptomyces lancefieldiae]|uniref:MarR family winged helix-turn-helix transcriptional regulator n=1 Tax=Streptomyces lancefieldiae TaxID=3075520 RepID=A0ABU3ALA1_9ACTN|nr:MarR family winged helix-turn-helix transcriptional regulator [Streptomyces sp. DSM 40712]MDT0610974.1 MarR family winged helix-turn-helix transcriptional regulator [Streptomyces sp. DSM 40712]